MPFRILSLDGGGLRGLITVRLLQRVAQRQGLARFIDRADLIVGTSTGGLLALGLASGRDLEEMAGLYLEHGKDIFRDAWWDNVRDLGKVRGADYDSKGLAAVLRRLFGDSTLGDLGRHVAITAFDLDNEATDEAERTWKPKIFHNLPGGDTKDRSERVVDVGLATAAAPTYFPSHKGYVDGGVFANNPAMVGLAQALDRRNAARLRPALDDIRLLSVGTGKVGLYVKGAKHDWGYAQWAPKLSALLMDGVMGIADFQCAQLLGEHYCRLQVPVLPNEPHQMDRVPALPVFDQIGRQRGVAEVNRVADWVQRFWM
ncbi:patatin-like phospholipase family protein [Silanimonas lenta]|uniref:patatin-like phospholipase family protein n=1 Tax=Silanimonas lenta TaxID=265429 RepID=UPI002FE25718